MINETLEGGLKKLGLDDKEAKVYLSALELGPSPVQKISQRAQVPRATTYLVLEDLKHKGLITTFEKGKKTFFAAESPLQLEALVTERMEQIAQQQTLLKELVPELKARGQFKQSARPMVRYYEGDRAVTAFIHDSLLGKGGEVLNIFHLDRATDVLSRTNFPIEKVRERRAQHNIHSRVIYTSKKGPIPGYSTPERQAKYVNKEKFPFEADISVRGNTVFFVPYSTPLRGVAIEDAAIAQSMRMVFELLWQQLSE